jgi:signal transduction histidine kinase
MLGPTNGTELSWIRALSRAIDAGIVLLAPDKTPEFASARALELLGCADLDELTRRWPSILRDIEHALAKPVTRASHVTADVELQVGDQTRRMRWRVHWAEGDNCEAHVLLVRDLDVVAALDRDLRLASRFSSLMRVHAGLSHELRSLLNALGLQTELVKQSIDDEGQVAEGELAGIQRQLGRLTELIGVFVKQSEPPNENRSAFDVRDVLREIAQLLGPVARHQRVELALEGLERGALVCAQRDPVKQALIAIAVNGLETMPSGGRLTLRSDVQNQRVHITIADTGAGIPEVALLNIWDMDFTTREGRSGLGLYVARSTLLENHGTVEVEVTSPSGTRIRVELPVAKPEDI